MEGHPMTDNYEDRRQRFIAKFEDGMYMTEEESRVLVEKRKAEIRAFRERLLREAAEQRKREIGGVHDSQTDTNSPPNNDTREVDAD